MFNALDRVIVIDNTTHFHFKEPAMVLTVERGAKESPYYVWDERRKVGEWLAEYQIEKI